MTEHEHENDGPREKTWYGTAPVVTLAAPNYPLSGKRK